MMYKGINYSMFVLLADVEMLCVFMRWSVTERSEVCSGSAGTQHHTHRVLINSPQRADKATGGSLSVKGANVPNVQETGHLIHHGRKTPSPAGRRTKVRTSCCLQNHVTEPCYGTMSCVLVTMRLY